MQNKLKAIPHFFTFSNIFLGFLAIIYISRESFITAAWCIVIASLFDMIDGKVARLTKTHSRFGVELDSLADVISFGAAPAFLIFKSNFSTVGPWGIIFSFLYLLAGVFRLARFNANIKGYSKKNFSGLPIPVAALAIATFMLFTQNFWDVIAIVPAFLVLVPAVSILMVSNIEYETIPRLFLSRSIKRNIKPLSYLIGFACVFFYPREAFFPGTLLYMLKGIFVHFTSALSSDQDSPEIQMDEDKIIK